MLLDLHLVWLLCTRLSWLTRNLSRSCIRLIWSNCEVNLSSTRLIWSNCDLSYACTRLLGSRQRSLPAASPLLVFEPVQAPASLLLSSINNNFSPLSSPAPILPHAPYYLSLNFTDSSQSPTAQRTSRRCQNIPIIHCPQIFQLSRLKKSLPALPMSLLNFEHLKSRMSHLLNPPLHLPMISKLVLA